MKWTKNMLHFRRFTNLHVLRGFVNDDNQHIDNDVKQNE